MNNENHGQKSAAELRARIDRTQREIENLEYHLEGSDSYDRVEKRQEIKARIKRLEALEHCLGRVVRLSA